MKPGFWVPISLVLSMACQQPAADDNVDEIEGNPNAPVKILIAKNMELEVAHWVLKGSMGVVVAKKHEGAIDDRAKLVLEQEFEQIFEQYNFAAMNLCKSEKPTPKWSDEEWSEFRREPIIRLNAAIGTAVIDDIYCEGMVFTEYEIVLTDTPVPSN
jgi:hypothetical protein